MNDSINYLEIGARIRRQREQIGLTQEQLGEACDLSTSFVGHIERGSRKLSVESLFRIASVLGISADSLLFDRMEQETTLPSEIASFLKGSDPVKRSRFWRTVRILAGHIDEM
jgi:transcriptional regulator with XRE-family HTH domain